MTEPARKPDFIVVGAPKCGTTTLHAFLRSRPGIFVPAAKEPNFFATDVAIRKRLSEKAYLDLFRQAGAARRVGEVSVWYLYSRRSARAIRELCGPVDIIAMLRHPIDAMHSLHSQFVFNGDEDILDFGAALAAEEERGQGRRMAADAWVGAECLCYRRVTSYADQIERYLGEFGAERVHVVLFDDFVRDPAKTCEEVLGFLGLDGPVRRPDIGRLNVNKRLRRPWLRRLHRRYERPLRSGARSLLPSSSLRRRLGTSLVRLLKRSYSRVAERPPVAAELRARLSRELEPEVRRLGELIGRDLGFWLEPELGWA